MWQLHWAIFMRGTKRMHLQQWKYLCGSVYLLAVCHTTEPPEPQSVTLSAMGLTEWQWAGSPGDPSIISYIFYHQASGTQDDQHLNEDRNVNTGNDLRVEIGSLSPYTTYTYCVVVIYHRCQSVLQKLLWKQLVCPFLSCSSRRPTTKFAYRYFKPICHTSDMLYTLHWIPTAWSPITWYNILTWLQSWTSLKCRQCNIQIA